jgi:sec-independent protein translocase protein TatA
MFAFLDSPVEIGIIVLVVLLLFGGSQLPKLAKNLGQAQKEFKDGLNTGQKGEDGKPLVTEVTKTTTTTVPVAPVVPPSVATTVTTTDAERAEELRRLEARMAELKSDQPQPRSTEI